MSSPKHWCTPGGTAPQRGLRTLTVTLLFGLMLGTSAWATELVDRIVAEVNDQIVSLSELNQAMAPYAAKIAVMGYSEDQRREMLRKLHDDMLQKLIDQKLTDQEAKRLKLSVSDKELDAAIDRVKSDNKIDGEDAFRKALAGEGLTPESYRARLKEQLLRNKLVNYEVKSKIVITREDVRAYYERNQGAVATERRVHLRHILLQVAESASATQKEEVRRRAEGLHAKLKAGADFGSLAREYSDSPGAAEGGELGWFSIGELALPVQQAIAGLKPGQFSAVLDTDSGFQIFLLAEAELPPEKPLEEVSSEIEEKLYREIVDRKFESWIESLRKRSHIKIAR
jgi:peptidyl-prolyl cis-trans isomerase SurA